MILSNTPQDKAILSNVGEIGEFRIRNSAKAFSILSSGLYANKIRAIIRELSCNAIDSHVAAGRPDTPFDLHLPNALEPYFSIRDYGVGLDHSQVTNIYTTYFESTKTGSNDYIGALGLGSKSPFSYIDNFTVTAVKDGRKGIYTAFINENGVPSIALMMEEQTDAPNGVEVRFAVDNARDYGQFRQEAQYVYEFFNVRPVVSGYTGFTFVVPNYASTDIVPGVHQLSGSTGHTSYAIMGNIKYPIDVPNASQTLGDLHRLLSCRLVIHFNIGELDFQASREGLSYIPQTIEAIRKKLQTLNDRLAGHVKENAEKISNLWERAFYLKKTGENSLWNAAVKDYVKSTNFDLFNSIVSNYLHLKTFNFTSVELAEKYNIKIRGFYLSTGADTCVSVKECVEYKQDSSGKSVSFHKLPIEVTEHTYFVLNDTGVGATERAKYHWKNSKIRKHDVQTYVYVLEKNSKDKPAEFQKFLKDIKSPPDHVVLNASDLLQKERASSGKNVTVMHLTKGASRGRWNSTAPIVWRDAGKANDFDPSNTYYYLPLSGFQNLGVYSDVKQMHTDLNKSGVYTGQIYGVRKSDIEWVKTQKNWVNLDTMIRDKLAKIGKKHLMGLVKKTVDVEGLYRYNCVNNIKNLKSPYIKLFDIFKEFESTDQTKFEGTRRLMQTYGTSDTNDSEFVQLVSKYKAEVFAIYSRYPLLRNLSGAASAESVSEYINLIDDVKGV